MMQIEIECEPLEKKKILNTFLIKADSVTEERSKWDQDITPKASLYSFAVWPNSVQYLIRTYVFLAAVSVGFGNKLVTRVITLRFGIARNQGFGFAPAAVNPSLHVRLACGSTESREI